MMTPKGNYFLISYQIPVMAEISPTVSSLSPSAQLASWNHELSEISAFHLVGLCLLSFKLQVSSFLFCPLAIHSFAEETKSPHPLGFVYHVPLSSESQLSSLEGSHFTQAHPGLGSYDPFSEGEAAT